MNLDRLRKVAEQATQAWERMPALDREYYAMPESGAFVGEHTKAVVIDAPTVTALLDVAEALLAVDQWERRLVGEVNDFTSFRRIVDPALDRLREVTGC
jgi:fructose-1,6-bisphosphatase/inositol monophosphatase family enzyme